MQDILRATRSELRKILSLRSSLIYAILLTGSLYGPVILVAAFGERTAADWTNLIVGAPIFVMISIIYGAAVTAGEYSNGMDALSRLVQQRRSSWLVGRMVATALFLTMNFAVGILAALFVTVVFPSYTLALADMSPVWLALLSVTAFGVAAVGIAGITRNRVLAVGLPLVWLMIIESLIHAGSMSVEFLGEVIPWLPGNAQILLVDGTDVGHNMLVVALWTIGLIIAGLVVHQRRDVK